MPRSPLSLAAAAQAALPGASIVGVRSATVPGDFDAAQITLADGQVLQVEVNQTELAGATQQANVTNLKALHQLPTQFKLPFQVPVVKGTASLDDGGRAVVTTLLRGAPVELEALTPGPGLAGNVGRAIAAIHEIPTSIAERLALETFTADEYRQRHLAGLDAVAETGKVPSVLLDRWEQALDDVTLWRFQPVFIHGDLGAEFLLTDGDQVTGIDGWANARVADPADDLAWLLAGVSPETADSILEAYQMRRTESRDPGLAERALLISEIAIARWLHYGVRENDPEIIADGQAMLAELVDSLSG